MTKEIADWHMAFCERYGVAYDRGLANAHWTGVFGPGGYKSGKLLAAGAEEVYPDPEMTLKICQFLAHPSKDGVRALSMLMNFYRWRLREGPYGRIMTDVLYTNRGMRRRIEAAFGLAEPYAVVYCWGKEQA